MILDVIQIVLLLVCTGLISFVCYRLTSDKAQLATHVNQEDALENLPEPDLHEIREALIAYIDRESRVLELDDFGPDTFIGYSCGDKPHYGHFKIWLAIWVGTDLDIIATSLRFGREHHDPFERLKENKNKIEWLFPEEEVDYNSFSGDIQGIGVEKRVDLSQRENWNEISVWVRENLEKLLYMIRLHDVIQESNTQESEDDIPF